MLCSSLLRSRNSLFNRPAFIYRYACLHSKSSTNAMASENVLLTEKDAENGVITFTLNRPRQRNALNNELLESLHHQLGMLIDDPCHKMRCVVIRANGPAFCSGHDLKEMTCGNLSEKEQHELFKKCSDVMALIEKIPQPVIAAVHGIATAAGCQLAAACDMAVATGSARFATPGVHIGLFCSTPAVPLVRSVGRKAAMDMLLTGRLVDADEAYKMGLISRVVHASSDSGEEQELARVVQELSYKIAGNSGAALEIGKKTFKKQVDLDLQSAYDVASKAMARNLQTIDAGEGINAFLQKTKPVWKNR